MLFSAGLALLSQSSALGEQGVMLTWNPSPVAGVAGYKIYYGTAAHDYSQVIDAGSSTNVTIPALPDSSTNYFSATTYDSLTNESSHSDEVVFVVPSAVSRATDLAISVVTNSVVDPTLTSSAPSNSPPVLNVVGNLVVTTNPADAGSVLVTWDASADAGATGYQVFYGTASGDYPNLTNLGLVNNFMVSGLLAGTTNYFAVRAFDAGANVSPMSAEVNYFLPVIAPPPPVLNVVANLLVTTNPADASSLILTWDASTDAGVVGYQVYGGMASGNYLTVTNLGLVNSLTVTGLVGGTTNFFAVREYDSAWNASSMSAESSYFLPLSAKLPPTLNVISDLSINMNTSGQVVALTGIAAGFPSTNAVVRITAKSSNTNVIPNPKVVYVSPAGTGYLKIKPLTGASGVVSITVTVDDGSASNNLVTQTFKVTVINTIRVAALPKFLKQPKGAIVALGRSTSMGVTTTGAGPLHYQWKRNGTNVSGATGATLSFRNVTTNSAGLYSVLVWNSWGATNSAVAELSLLMPTSVPVQTNIVKNIVAAPAAKAALSVASTIPTISAPFRINNHFSFQITGLTGGTYVVLASEDLKNWSPVQTNTAPFTYTESNGSSFGQRFYRAQFQP